MVCYGSGSPDSVYVLYRTVLSAGSGRRRHQSSDGMWYTSGSCSDSFFDFIFLWNGVIAVCVLWKHRSFRLRFSYLRHYLSGCLRDGQITSYENPDDESKYLHLHMESFWHI